MQRETKVLYSTHMRKWMHVTNYTTIQVTATEIGEFVHKLQEAYNQGFRVLPSVGVSKIETVKQLVDFNPIEKAILNDLLPSDIEERNAIRCED